MIKGVDISNFQGSPDFNQVKSQVDFVICKASEGTGFTDPTFKNNQENIRTNGLLCGFYHFARPDLGNSATSEADYFLSVVGELKEGEILVLDYEVNFSTPVSWCKDFLAEVFNKTGCRPLIYLNLNLVRTNDWTPVINENYGLWLADYDGVSDNTPDTPWPTVAMKQWSSTGQISGISGNVDVDTFFGDATAFKAYGYHATIPQPTPQPTSQLPQYFQTLLQENNLDLNNESQIRAFFQQAIDFPSTNTDKINAQTALATANNKIADLQGKNNDLQKKLTACQNSSNATLLSGIDLNSSVVRSFLSALRWFFPS